MEGDQIRGRLQVAHKRASACASHFYTQSTLPLIARHARSAGGRALGQRDQSLPAPHAPTLALVERLQLLWTETEDRCPNLYLPASWSSFWYYRAKPCENF